MITQNQFFALEHHLELNPGKLERISKFLCLLHKLSTHITNTTQAWSRFKNTEDTSFFDNADDERTYTILRTFEESFDRLSGFQDDLDRMEKTCKMMVEVVSRVLNQLTLYYSHS